MDPICADAGGDQREPWRCRGVGRPTPFRLIVMETSTIPEISESCNHLSLWKWNDFCLQTFDSAFYLEWKYETLTVDAIHSARAEGLPVTPQPEALTFACKKTKQNHNECFCFYPGISECAKFSARYAQPNMNHLHQWISLNLCLAHSSAPKLKFTYIKWSFFYRLFSWSLSTFSPPSLSLKQNKTF